jgi:hypothetical protein
MCRRLIILEKTYSFPELTREVSKVSGYKIKV